MDRAIAKVFLCRELGSGFLSIVCETKHDTLAGVKRIALDKAAKKRGFGEVFVSEHFYLIPHSSHTGGSIGSGGSIGAAGGSVSAASGASAPVPAPPKPGQSGGAPAPVVSAPGRAPVVSAPGAGGSGSFSGSSNGSGSATQQQHNPNAALPPHMQLTVAQQQSAQAGGFKPVASELVEAMSVHGLLTPLQAGQTAATPTAARTLELELVRRADAPPIKTPVVISRAGTQGASGSVTSYSTSLGVGNAAAAAAAQLASSPASASFVPAVSAHGGPVAGTGSPAIAPAPVQGGSPTSLPAGALPASAQPVGSLNTTTATGAGANVGAGASGSGVAAAAAAAAGPVAPNAPPPTKLSESGPGRSHPTGARAVSMAIGANSKDLCAALDCRMPLLGTVYSVFGLRFHTSHLMCVICKMSLVNKLCFLNNDRLLCDVHHNLLKAEEAKRAAALAAVQRAAAGAGAHGSGGGGGASNGAAGVAVGSGYGVGGDADDGEDEPDSPTDEPGRIARPSVSLKMCAECRGFIETNPISVGGGKHVHAKCLRCHTCGIALGPAAPGAGNTSGSGSGSNRYFLTDDPKPGTVLCDRDYNALYDQCCAGCGLHLTSEYVRALDAKWHAKCFICSYCRVELHNKEFCVKDDNVYCLPDYDRLFAVRCDGCFKTITGPYIEVPALAQLYHPACLVCTHCRVGLEGKEFFHDDNSDGVYCRTHYETLFAVKCVVCHLFIQGEVTRAVGKDFHKDCFVCTVCHEPLGGNFEFDTEDSKLYCSSHYRGMIRKRSSVAASRQRSGSWGKLEKLQEQSKTARANSKQNFVQTGPPRPSAAGPSALPPHNMAGLRTGVGVSIIDRPSSHTLGARPTVSKGGPSRQAPKAPAPAAGAGAGTGVGGSAAAGKGAAAPNNSNGAASPTSATAPSSSTSASKPIAIPTGSRGGSGSGGGSGNGGSTTPLTVVTGSPGTSNGGGGGVFPVSPPNLVGSGSGSRSGSGSSTPTGSSLPKDSSVPGAGANNATAAATKPAPRPSAIASMFQRLTSSSNLNKDKDKDKDAGGGANTKLPAAGAPVTAAASTSPPTASSDAKAAAAAAVPFDPKRPRRGSKITSSELAEFISKGIGVCLEGGLGGLDDRKAHAWTTDVRKKINVLPSHWGLTYEFQDYAPQTFALIRKRYGISTRSFYESVVTHAISGGGVGAGKSGMLFYFSRDRRFVFKTITRSELAFFRKILKEYYQHLLDNPHTLLPRFYSMCKIKLPGAKAQRLIVMNNLFFTRLPIHEKFDLKGSVHNRLVTQEEIEHTPGGVLKDMNFKTKMWLGDEQKAAFAHQLRRDCALLVQCNIMDQSLLLGVHAPVVATTTTTTTTAGPAPDSAAALAATATATAATAPTAANATGGNAPASTTANATAAAGAGAGAGSATAASPTGAAATAAAATAAAADDKPPQQLKPICIADLSKPLLPSGTGTGELISVWQSCGGGLRAFNNANTNANPNALPGCGRARREIYFMGVIDILQEFDLKKKVESAVKGIRYNKRVISAVESKMYADRMVAFLLARME